MVYVCVAPSAIVIDGDIVLVVVPTACSATLVPPSALAIENVSPPSTNSFVMFDMFNL